jgi:hypothetical protein
LFPFFPAAERWRAKGREVVSEQMRAQVRDDGSHFEQSLYYHVYAIDFFVFHALLERVSGEYLARLSRMCEFLAAAMGQARRLPLIGDDDGGRLFHPYGQRDLFGRATLATSALLLGDASWSWSEQDLDEQALWWFGPERIQNVRPRLQSPKTSAWFPDAGIAVFTRGSWHVIVDAGPFGSGSGGHSHADVLSIVVRQGDRDILIDPGTYTYVGDAEWRQHFRGTAAHNTVRIDELDQAAPQGPFRWIDKPAVSVLHVGDDTIDAVCRYRGFAHRRRVHVRGDGVFVLDEISGPDGEHNIEQFWHAGAGVEPTGSGSFRISPEAVLSVTVSAEVLPGWRSPAFGAKEPAAIIRAGIRSRLPVALAAVIQDQPTEIRLERSKDAWVLTSGSSCVEFEIEAHGIINTDDSRPATVRR